MTNIIATTKAASPDGTMSAELYRELQRMGRATSAAAAAAAANTQSLADFIAGADWGSVIYKGETDWVWLAPGTAGQFLQTNGPDANPGWADIPSLTRLSSKAASGATVDFTGIPSTANFIYCAFDQVSGNSSSTMYIQIGGAGGIENTGYVSTDSITTAFNTRLGGNAGDTYTGVFTLMRLTGNTWIMNGNGTPNSGTTNQGGAGTKTLSDTLTQVRFLNAGGSNYDAGTLHVSYL